MPETTVVLVTMLVAGGVLLRFRTTLRETTLVSTWWWTWGALWCLTWVELLPARQPAGESPTWLAGLRLIAGGLTLCPALSLMGAKRPQDVGWNWVVLALWGVLILPVAVAWLRPTATPLAAYGPLAWFLWVLIALGFVNLVPTRFWPVAFTLPAGQVFYLADHLPLVPEFGPWRVPVALGLFGGSLLLAAALAGLPTTAHNPRDRAWLDFRDTFGLFWALRVQERLNDAAVKLAWPVRLTWRGFVSTNPDQPSADWPPELEKAVRQSMRGLLRRFVSPAWLQARWGHE